MGKGECNTAEADLEVVILLPLFFFNIVIIIRGTKQDPGLFVQGTILTCRTERGTLVRKSSNRTFYRWGTDPQTVLNDRSRWL